MDVFRKMLYILGDLVPSVPLPFMSLGFHSYLELESLEHSFLFAYILCNSFCYVRLVDSNTCEIKHWKTREQKENFEHPEYLHTEPYFNHLKFSSSV